MLFSRLGAVVIFCVTIVSSGQSQTGTLRRITQDPKVLTLSIGLTSPQGRVGIREFWLSGPSISLLFTVPTKQNLALGVGTDISMLYFDQGAFAMRWPNVPLAKKDNLFIGNVYLDATLFILPGSTVNPFLSAQCGAEFISEAVYRDYVAGVRQTYYEVGGKTRLALNLAAGADYALGDSFGLRGELKGTIVNNDPNVSTLAHVRLGVQYKL